MCTRVRSLKRLDSRERWGGREGLRAATPDRLEEGGDAEDDHGMVAKGQKKDFFFSHFCSVKRG